jgi:hypothetical protein
MGHGGRRRIQSTTIRILAGASVSGPPVSPPHYCPDWTAARRHTDPKQEHPMNLSDLTAKAKDLIAKRGGTESLEEDAGELKDIAGGSGSATDKARAAFEAIREPGAPDHPAAPSTPPPTPPSAP